MASSLVRRQLMRQLRRTVDAYGLLQPGDHLMVAVSGGKDSHGLLSLLRELVRGLGGAVRLIAVHLDQGQPGYDGAALEAYLRSLDVPHEILRQDTYSVVRDKTPVGGTYCAVCSRLRRGTLYDAAARLGCNKIALGHHRDDALETFLLNLLRAGKLQAMPATYRTDDGRFEVIRPLIQCPEEKLAALAAEERFPILPCNLCGTQPGLERDRMTALLGQLEAQQPDVKAVMMAALANVCPTHLLDRDVAQAWQARDADIPAKGTLAGRRLPLLER